MKILKLLLKVVLVIISAVALTAVGVIIFRGCSVRSFKSNMAKSDVAYVVIDETKTKISTEDLNALKSVFANTDIEVAGSGSSCGFMESYSVELVNSGKNKKIVLCPACDKCRLFRVGATTYEVTEKARDDFEAIVEKYGLTFPHI